MAMIKLNARQLRKGEPGLGRDQIQKKDIYILLDNVLDTYNIGSIFRLADAVAAKKIYLCGETATPPNSRIKKASINTTEWVDWEYFPTTIEALKKLKTTIPDLSIVAIEQDSDSLPYDKLDYSLPVCLVVGNESLGISKEVLQSCDTIVELPMAGVNISLNVMVSLGIVLYQALETINL